MVHWTQDRGGLLRTRQQHRLRFLSCSFSLKCWMFVPHLLLQRRSLAGVFIAFLTTPHGLITSPSTDERSRGGRVFPHLPLLPLVVVQHGRVQPRHQVITAQLDRGHGPLHGRKRRHLQLVVEPVDMGQFLHNSPALAPGWPLQGSRARAHLQQLGADQLLRTRRRFHEALTPLRALRLSLLVVGELAREDTWI